MTEPEMDSSISDCLKQEANPHFKNFPVRAFETLCFRIFHLAFVEATPK